MSTATAIATRPLVYTAPKVEVELVKARPEDFKTLDRWGDDRRPIYKLKTGMVYWLFSMSKGCIQPTPYIVDEHTDAVTLKEYLDADMVYVAKNPFKN